MNGLSAFIETVNFLKNNVIKHNWSYGAELINGANQISKSYGISEFFNFSGIACSPFYNCLDTKNKIV